MFRDYKCLCQAGGRARQSSSASDTVQSSVPAVQQSGRPAASWPAPSRARLPTTKHVDH